MKENYHLLSIGYQKEPLIMYKTMVNADHVMLLQLLHQYPQHILFLVHNMSLLLYQLNKWFHVHLNLVMVAVMVVGKSIGHMNIFNNTELNQMKIILMMLKPPVLVVIMLRKL